MQATDFVSHLTNTILPFWTERMPDLSCGGYFGRIDGENRLHPEAAKGAVLHARILWTFSAAARVLNRPDYLPYAERAYTFLLRAFDDKLHGGIVWSVDRRGHAIDVRKQIYANAFVIYALAEYARVANDANVLEKAVELFDLVERHSRDKVRGGYVEAFTRDWQTAEDVRLSAKDANEKKTMNTHLHVLEAYAGLYRVWPDPRLAEALRALLEVFAGRLLNQQTGHLSLFMTEDWQRTSAKVSYGHDIEASWLVEEAASALGEAALGRRIGVATMRLAEAACEGLQPDGSLINERDEATGHADPRRDWWPQAEAVVGFLHAWQKSGQDVWLARAEAAWSFIRTHLVDRGQGEWFWGVDESMRPLCHEDKAGFWKCPYHNGRMCLEAADRLGG